MEKRATIVVSVVVLMFFFGSVDVVAAGNGNVSGYVRDGQTGEVLPGANVMIVGTSLGGASDIIGRFVILNIPPGSYTIRTSYLGYKTKETTIQVGADADVKLDFKLAAVAIEGKEVVVTAQVAGQNSAVNQQLSSNQIVNVVSAAKIQELPDANAAESVGRLPGVSLLRNGGEATEVVIRGLQPKYNMIMVDGIQMSSSDPNDRSTDLSSISSNMLEGIQVSKSVTPDMDASVMGGTVNFELREAQVKEVGVPQFGLLAQGGYNNLSDAYNKYNNYKYVGSVEDRLLDDRLGIFAQGAIERKNLTSNELGASYTHAGNSTSQYYTTGLNLYDIPRDIQRANGALVVDYKLPEGKIKFSNFLSSSTSTTQDREEDFDIADNQHLYNLSNTGSLSHSATNGLDFQQQLPIFQMDAKVSNTYSDTKDPNDWSVNFLQQSAGLGQFNNVGNVNPQDVPKAANNDLSRTIINLISTSNSFSKERASTASLDLKTNINFSDAVSADIKFGGMYRYVTRAYTYEIYNGGGLQFGDAGYVNQLILSQFSLPSNLQYNIPLSDFADPSFNYGKFLNGSYSMNTPLNSGMLAEMANVVRNNAAAIAANNGTAAYGRNNFLSTTSNYSGTEDQSAFYVMSTVNVGSQFTLIPGVRYQDLRSDYTGTRGVESRLSFNAYNHYDTSVVQNHGYWLPDVSLRYKPLSWFDVRLSYTNTLAYPDYNAIIPRIDVGTGAIAWNNYQLVPSQSKNYDVYFSFYDNTVGLLTVGPFLKQITNLIYPWTFYVSGTGASPYFPPGLLGTSSPSGTYSVTTFVNDSYQINNYGLELDWQTHFWYLPGAFSGLLFNVNYTHIFSKAQYPFVNIATNGRTTNYVDTSFTDRLLDQPDNIVNLSLGYDYQNFSIRVSMLYQADIFTGVNYWPQLRSNTSAYTRWDLAVKQELPWSGLQLYGDLNNINGATDISVIQGGGVPISEQDYGLTATLGMRISL